VRENAFIDPHFDAANEQLQRCGGDLTFLKMTAVRHPGFWKFKFFNGLGG